LRSIGDGVITTDLEGRIILINKVTEQLTGWDRLEAVGRPVPEVFNIINERTGQPCNNPVDKVLATEEVVELESHTVLISKDGTRYNIEDSGAPIFNENSRIIGTVLVFRDVTEKRKTEKELLKVQKLESVGVLAGGIAHDFNNILAAIMGNINLSLRDPALTGKSQRLLDQAQKASFRARDLTQQLLTFAKGGAAGQGNRRPGRSGQGVCRFRSSRYQGRLPLSFFRRSLAGGYRQGPDQPGGAEYHSECQ
jgi:PAS domain S-box-containing protein